MLVLAGALLLVLGLASGLFLTLAALGALSVTPGATPWLLFPVLTVAGYLLIAIPSRTSALPLVSRLTGAGAIALAVLAAAALVLVSTSVVPRPASTLSLWYVLVVGLALGGAGLSAHTAPGSKA